MTRTTQQKCVFITSRAVNIIHSVIVSTALEAMKTIFAVSYYFRFRICWCHSLPKVKIYPRNKSRRHIFIHGWDITTSRLERQTSAILEFYFRFLFRPYRIIGTLSCISLPNFIQIGPSAAEIWRHINFQDGGSQPCWICFGVMADHTRSVFCGLSSVFKSVVGLINISGECRSTFTKFIIKPNGFLFETQCVMYHHNYTE